MAEFTVLYFAGKYVIIIYVTGEAVT